VLHLVDHRAALPLRDEAARVGHGLCTLVEVFERDVGVGGKGRARERGLSRLSRARQHDDGKAARQTLRTRQRGARDPRSAHVFYSFSFEG
jgi:hypothetical protein